MPACDDDAAAFDLPPVKPVEGDATLDVLRAKMRDAIRAEARVEELELQLKAAKGELLHLRRMVIPELMVTIGSDDFTLDGTRFRNQLMVEGSLPKEPVARKSAIDWLVANEADGIIKTEIVLEFPRSEHSVAKEVYEKLRDDGQSPLLSETVHAQTLMAFARERLKNGQPLSDEDQLRLGLHFFQIAKMEKVKEK
jgi:hypothetical protein